MTASCHLGPREFPRNGRVGSRSVPDDDASAAKRLAGFRLRRSGAASDPMDDGQSSVADDCGRPTPPALPEIVYINPPQEVIGTHQTLTRTVSPGFRGGEFPSDES